MVKFIKYFFQALIIYSFFIIIKLIGLKLSRNLFSYLFNKIGPLIKSNAVINENLDEFIGPYNEKQKIKLKQKMWANYGKTFVEYLFIKKFSQNLKYLH